MRRRWVGATSDVIGIIFPVHQTGVERRRDVEVLPNCGEERESGPERVDLANVLELSDGRCFLWRRMLADGGEEVGQMGVQGREGVYLACGMEDCSPEKTGVEKH